MINWKDNILNLTAIISEISTLISLRVQSNYQPVYSDFLPSLVPHSLTLIIFPNDQRRKQEKALPLLLLHWISSAWNQSHSHKIEIRLSHSLHGNTLVAFPHPQKKIPSSSQDTHIWPLAHSHNPPQFSHFSSSSLLWSISWSFCYSLTVCAHALSKACRLAHLY